MNLSWPGNRVSYFSSACVLLFRKANDPLPYMGRLPKYTKANTQKYTKPEPCFDNDDGIKKRILEKQRHAGTDHTQVLSRGYKHVCWSGKISDIQM